MESELIVPGGAEQLAADTALAGILAEQGSNHASEHPQVLRGYTILEPTVILTEDHIQNPVQTVFDTPVPTGGTAQLLSAAPAAADVVGYLEGFLAAFPFGPRHPDDGFQVHPFLPRAQPLQIVQYQAHVLLLATVTTQFIDPHVMLEAHEVGLEGSIDAGVDVGFQEGLVTLDLQQVVGPCVADRLRDVLLAAHGINRHQRPLQFQQFEQLGDGSDLVGLVLNGYLPQGQGVGSDPGAYQIQAGAVQTTAATQSFAIDLDMLDPQAGADGVDPSGEAILLESGE